MTDQDLFNSAVHGYGAGLLSADAVVNCLGSARRADTAALAREELKRIMLRRENVDDVLGLFHGPLWTVEEEKTFEYGLFLYDGSTPDRFGKIALLMCGARSRDECKKRYMRLILDVTQIELGTKTASVQYLPSFPGAASSSSSSSSSSSNGAAALPSPTGTRPGQVWMM